MSYSYDRTAQRDGSSFKSLDDFWMFMLDQRDWKSKDESDSHVFVKRVQGVWVELRFSKSFWSSTVRIGPTTLPDPGVPVSHPDWRKLLSDLNQQLRSELEIKTVSFADVEREVERMASKTRELSTRKQRDYDRIWWRGARGKDAYKAWLKEVEGRLQEILDESAGQDWDTAGLVGNIIDNYMLDLGGMARKDQSRAIRTMLDSMARRGKIEKTEGARGEPKWIGRG